MSPWKLFFVFSGVAEGHPASRICASEPRRNAALPGEDRTVLIQQFIASRKVEVDVQMTRPEGSGVDLSNVTNPTSLSDSVSVPVGLLNDTDITMPQNRVVEQLSAFGGTFLSAVRDVTTATFDPDLTSISIGSHQPDPLLEGPVVTPEQHTAQLDSRLAMLQGAMSQSAAAPALADMLSQIAPTSELPSQATPLEPETATRPVAGAQQISGIASMLQKIVPASEPDVSDMVRKTMAAIDLNKDGMADFAEMDSFSVGRGQGSATIQEFKGVDRDDNGRIDLNELAVALQVAPGSTNQQRVASAPVSPPHAPAVNSLPARSIIPAQSILAAAPPIAAATQPAVAKTLGAVDAVVFSEQEASNAQAETGLISTQLLMQAEKEARAANLESEAAQLRANATAHSRIAELRISEASANAAVQISKRLAAEIANLEAQVETAEAEAASLRAKGRAAAQAAGDLMAAAEAALQDAATR